MPQYDLQKTFAVLEDRLLRAEGNIFALRAIVLTTLTADDTSSGLLKKQLEISERVLAEAMSNASDEGTRMYVSAAKAFISGLLDEGSLRKPNHALQ